ncbi:hypothetical protein HK096_005736, partial [Nowakowskiella sp. JEL0078]
QIHFWTTTDDEIQPEYDLDPLDSLLLPLPYSKKWKSQIQSDLITLYFDTKAGLKEKSLELQERKLKLEDEKFKLEKEERKAQLEAQLQQTQLMMTLIT